MSFSGSFYSIKAFNPHEATHPGHKVVSEETLILIKLLRDQGAQVLVEPDDGRPIEYLFRKGFRQFFSDPLVISFGLGFASSLAAAAIVRCVNWIWAHRHKEHIVSSHPPLTNILLRNMANESLFSYTGDPLEPKALNDLLAVANRQARQFWLAAQTPSPNIGLTVPIFLEHTARLVGWCDLECNETGLFTKHAHFSDVIALNKAKRGELRGMSITGIAQDSVCSICNSSYTECNHIAGVLYDSRYCINEIKRATLINVNLVAKPVNRDCYLRMMDQVSQSP